MFDIFSVGFVQGVWIINYNVECEQYTEKQHSHIFEHQRKHAFSGISFFAIQPKLMLKRFCFKYTF